MKNQDLHYLERVKKKKCEDEDLIHVLFTCMC